MVCVVRRLIASRGIEKIESILRIRGIVFLMVNERSYIYRKERSPVVLDQNWDN